MPAITHTTFPATAFEVAEASVNGLLVDVPLLEVDPLGEAYKVHELDDTGAVFDTVTPTELGADAFPDMS